MEDVSGIVASCNVPNSSRNHSSVKRKATETIAVTSLALHIYWTTTPKDGRKHDFWFVEWRVCVSSLMAITPLFFVLLHSLSLSPSIIFFDCAFFQWYVFLKLASYLVEITFALHIYMKMIKALGILTTWTRKPTKAYYP
jgi:hypothetical protein